MTEEIYEKIKEYRNSYHGAAELMGIKVTDVKKGWARGEILVQDHHLNPIGGVHGGVLFALADSTGGVAAWTHGELVTTSNGSIEYLNAARNVKKLISEATELKAGRNLLTYDVKITDETGKLICHVTLQYFSLHIPIGPRLEGIG